MATRTGVLSTAPLRVGLLGCEPVSLMSDMLMEARRARPLLALLCANLTSLRGRAMVDGALRCAVLCCAGAVRSRRSSAEGLGERGSQAQGRYSWSQARGSATAGQRAQAWCCSWACRPKQVAKAMRTKSAADGDVIASASVQRISDLPLAACEVAAAAAACRTRDASR